MGLKSQTSRTYRGLLWVGRAYRLAGWAGLVATLLFTTVAFFHHLRVMWNATYFTRTDILLQALLLGFLIFITGLVLSAVAFAISLGIQVGLTMMENSQIQIGLLRRIAQDQSETDSVLRLEENYGENTNISAHLTQNKQVEPREK